MNEKKKNLFLNDLSNKLSKKIAIIIKEGAKEYAMLTRKNINNDYNKEELRKTLSTYCEYILSTHYDKVINNLGSFEFNKIAKLNKTSKGFGSGFLKDIEIKQAEEIDFEEISDQYIFLKSKEKITRADIISDSILLFLLRNEGYALNKYENDLKAKQKQQQEFRSRSDKQKEADKLQEEIESLKENKQNIIAGTFLTFATQDAVQKSIGVASDSVVSFWHQIQEMQIKEINNITEDNVKKKYIIKKRWQHDSFINEFARPHHVALTGTVLNKNEEFILANPKTGKVETCLYPQEEKLSLSEKINCKCYVVYDYYLN